MRKITIFFVTLGLISMLFISPAAAIEFGEEGETEDNGVTIEISEEEEEEEEDSVLTPDSPFYFIKRFIEEIRLLLTFDQEKKAALLDELAEERAKELEALEKMYAEGELSEEQLAMLEKALDDLLLYTERLVEKLAQLQNPEGEPGEEGNDEVIEALEEEGNEEEKDLDKYQWRIAHLQSIADRAPEAAQKGLSRAISNAERQRERAIAKGKIPGDDEPENEASEEGELNNGDFQTLENGETENGELENGEAISEEGPPSWAPAHAREHWEWSQSGQEGPPPWAKAKSNGK